MNSSSDRAVLTLNSVVITLGVFFLVGTNACSDPLELNKCYRFESVNYEGDYIRHKNFELWKESGIGDQHWRDSTFKVVTAINGDDHQVSLQSVNYPERYAQHAGYKGYINKCVDKKCNENASWIVRHGFVNSTYCEDTVSFESDNYPGYFLRHASHRVQISVYTDTESYRKDASWVYHKVSCSQDFKCAAP